MGRGDQLARQWRIIQTLISSKHGESVAPTWSRTRTATLGPSTATWRLSRKRASPSIRSAGYIKEKIWHHTQRIEPDKDGSILFSAEVAGTDEVRHWILSWGRSAEVLEPQSLRKEVLQELSDCVKAYTRLSRKAEPA